MPVTHLNPDSLHRNPAFSQGVVVEPPGRFVFVGGQNGVDGSGAVVADDLASQTRQALLNIITVLEAAGATPADVVTMNVNLVAPADISAAFPVVGEVWGPHPAAVTVLQVADLGPEGALVEISAVAFLS
ncbi:RidA family protein [Microbacterium sp. CFBP9034]|uniref:RidA family protein n=1 Tax=Microbacterium sp. CFBP9034 TaxID=3096540 RepID=UPI002A6AC172|nr:RidA family protein [Microbacterium sp. CFBP9034]MDY0909550.1 RidA family protein [Microbacterium sp. CFBP9034]